MKSTTFSCRVLRNVPTWNLNAFNCSSVGFSISMIFTATSPCQWPLKIKIKKITKLKKKKHSFSLSHLEAWIGSKQLKARQLNTLNNKNHYYTKFIGRSSWYFTFLFVGPSNCRNKTHETFCCHTFWKPAGMVSNTGYWLTCKLCQIFQHQADSKWYPALQTVSPTQTLNCLFAERS